MSAAADSSCGELSKRCNEMRSTVAALYERRSSSRQQRSAVADRRYSFASLRMTERKILLVPTCSHSSS